MSNIKRCGCGKVPKKLHISDAGQGGKYANCIGDCCGEWTLEFRTDYKEMDSDECMALAITAWNDAPRNFSLIIEYTQKIIDQEAALAEKEAELKQANDDVAEIDEKLRIAEASLLKQRLLEHKADADYERITTLQMAQNRRQEAELEKARELLKLCKDTFQDNLKARNYKDEVSMSKRFEEIASYLGDKT